MKENTPWVKPDKMFRVEVVNNAHLNVPPFGYSEMEDFFMECFGDDYYVPAVEGSFYTNDLEGIKLFYKKYPYMIEDVESKIAFDNRTMIWDHINTED